MAALRVRNLNILRRRALIAEAAADVDGHAVVGGNAHHRRHSELDSPVFTAKLTSDPTTAQSVLTSTQDSTPFGVAARLQALGSTAPSATIGTITRTATSQDTRATDLQAQIASWDTRLALRRDTLTAQFTALTAR